MSAPAPLIVVSIPAASPAEARRQIDAIASARADLVEIRFDFWSPEARLRVAEIFPSRLPLIATLRSRAEGGRGPDDPVERAAILEALARHPFRWLDLESERDLGLLDRLPPAAASGRILSVHYPNGTSPETWGTQLRVPVAGGCVRKVVARAEIGPFLRDLLPRVPPPGEQVVVALTIGPSGPLSRAWARRIGVPMVYAAPPTGAGRETPIPPVEPSQVPVDRLEPFLHADGAPPLFGLAGHPVAHSLSPRIHGQWMARMRRPGLYVPLDFASESEFLGALEDLASGGFRGLNVTHPWKGAALEAATEVSHGAEICGVANTLTFRGESIDAENTDLAAILRRLEELKSTGSWSGGSLSVVGAGGAARATLAAARALGAEARVYARRPGAAVEVAEIFGAEPRAADDPRPDDLVVHATFAGREGAGTLAVPLQGLIRPGGRVLDWVYAADSSEIRESAERAGATYEDGRRLLVYQAAASFGVWWGEEPSREALAAALEEVGCTA